MACLATRSDVSDQAPSRERPQTARGRRCCTLQRRSPDRSDTGRLASPAETAQDAPLPPFAHTHRDRLNWVDSGRSPDERNLGDRR